MFAAVNNRDGGLFAVKHSILGVRGIGRTDIGRTGWVEQGIGRTEAPIGRTHKIGGFFLPRPPPGIGRTRPSAAGHRQDVPPGLHILKRDQYQS